jgi:hypothetical protein
MAFNSFYIDLAVTRDLASAPRTAAEISQTYRADHSGYDLVKEGRDMCILRVLETTPAHRHTKQWLFHSTITFTDLPLMSTPTDFLRGNRAAVNDVQMKYNRIQAEMDR